jgi:hypothetical protein
MKCSIRNVCAALVFVFGLTMTVWGGWTLIKPQKDKATAVSSEDGGSLRNDMIGSPTTGEVIKGLFGGPVGRTMGTLLITGVGVIMAFGALLTLAPRKETRAP